MDRCPGSACEPTDPRLRLVEAISISLRVVQRASPSLGSVSLVVRRGRASGHCVPRQSPGTRQRDPQRQALGIFAAGGHFVRGQKKTPEPVCVPGMSDSTSESTAAADSKPFQFRLVHAAYIVTLAASSLATFGWQGILPAVFISLFWSAVFTSRRRPSALATACVVVVVCGCLAGLLLPTFSKAREAARRMQCANNLKQIALALHNYESIYGSFPPAYIADENGLPMHSWRVLLLPFLEQEALYKKYNFQESWNGPNNSQLLSSMPPIYECPSNYGVADHHSCTSYVAVVGPHTAWPRDSGRLRSEITDGLAKTLQLIECDSQIPWLEPRDLELDQALALLDSSDLNSSGVHVTKRFFYEYYLGRNVAFSDGSVRFLGNGISRKTWSAMFGVDDGIVPSDAELDIGGVIHKKLNVGNCLRLAWFVFLAVFPLPWVWLNPRGKSRTSSGVATTK